METQQTETSEKEVKFDTIQVRSYKQIVGDHPDCIGPPVSLGWNYQESGSWSVDDYESARGSYRPDARKLHMSELRRETILKDHVGASDQEIKDAIFTVKQIQRQRDETLDRDFPIKDKRSFSEKLKTALAHLRKPTNYF